MIFRLRQHQIWLDRRALRLMFDHQFVHSFVLCCVVLFSLNFRGGVVKAV